MTAKQIGTWAGRNLLLILTIAGVVIGVVGGGLLRFLHLGPEATKFIGFPGELFMNMLKAMILPLILGIVIVMLIHPGDPSIKAVTETSNSKIANKLTVSDKFLDLLRNMMPENIVRSTFQQQQTVYVSLNSSEGLETWKTRIEYSDGMNVLARPLAKFFMALDAVITRMVFFIMWFGPIGIPSLIAHKMLEVSDLITTAKTLGMFIVTVIIGLSIQCFLTLPLIYFIGTRQNPYRFLRGLGQAVLTALGTSSSAASLPVTFRCLKELDIDDRITKFVLPVGAMVNMDGTALYEATASIFIAQMNGMELTIGKVLTVSVTATLASIGAASIPSAGLVTMMIVLTSLDRLRTSVNVIGDAFGCGFVYHLSKNDLDELPGKGSSQNGTLQAVEVINSKNM
ncbi:unnamed protein product [Nippostrongylus brasiliensis]|uniref:Amino acid transporter n=1 Tax=Nippostrongylus brasiliensis TaxID=27835 RepID=A0A0N4Y404_NIPBR|nr:unnamed protein product [Nippostrongylus brasiliensis]